MKIRFKSLGLFSFFVLSSLFLISCSSKQNSKKSEFLLIAGKPIGETIARGGPFVMNTKEEIIQAVEDYKSGKFAKY